MTELAEREDQTSEGQAQTDYFGMVLDVKRFMLPDGVSFIEYQPMNEGAKAKFERTTQRDVVLERTSGNARLKIDAAAERHELIRLSVVSWNLKRAGEPIPYSASALRDFLNAAPPDVIQRLERDIRRANPWLLGEATAADLREQIADLQEQLRLVEEREAGEESSSNK